MDKANLGLATTRELLQEVVTRIEIHGNIDYKPVGGLTPPAPTEAGDYIGIHGETPQPKGTEPVRVLPEGKKVVRTKSSGDRVYLLDEVKKTRQWVTNPDVLDSLGFELGDVGEVDENEMLKFQMGPALYRRVDEQS